MLFSSVPFLFYFLPAALLLYFLVPRRLKNAALLLASLFFYAWGEPKYVVSPIEEVFPYLFLVLRRTWNSGYLVEVIPYDRWGQVFNSHIDMYLKLKIHHFVYT